MLYNVRISKIYFVVSILLPENICYILGQNPQQEQSPWAFTGAHSSLNKLIIFLPALNSGYPSLHRISSWFTKNCLSLPPFIQSYNPIMLQSQWNGFPRSTMSNFGPKKKFCALFLGSHWYTFKMCHPCQNLRQTGLEATGGPGGPSQPIQSIKID